MRFLQHGRVALEVLVQHTHRTVVRVTSALGIEAQCEQLRILRHRRVRVLVIDRISCLSAAPCAARSLSMGFRWNDFGLVCKQSNWEAFKMTTNLKRLLKSIAHRLFSPGEVEALRLLWQERVIASHNRRGLSQLRKQSVTRPVKLVLGCGPHPKAGFLNVDVFPGGDLTLDLRRGLPFHSGCCELIFSEHCFEHFDYPEPITHLFRECLRVLKPGGELRFSVPGTEWPLNDYREGPGAPYFQACVDYRWHPQYCTTRLEHINYHFRQGTEHRYAYDFETAEKVLRAAGFVEIQERRFDASLDSKHREVGSLFMSARKPA